MSTIKIDGWKEVKDTDDPGLFIFVEPENSGYSWQVDRWWHDGRIIYETCARVDHEDSQIYIDGTTPSMKITIKYEDGNMVFSDYQDIRRVLICKDLLAVTRKETTEYIDIDFSPRNGYVVRYNGYPETPPGEPDPPTFFEPWQKAAKPFVNSSSLPITAGKVIECVSGSFTGGDPADDDLYWNRIKLQGRDSPSGSYSENNSAWTFLDLRSEGVPVTFTVFDLPVGGQIRIVQQHRLKASIDGDAQIQSNNSINYTVVEEVRVTSNGLWLSPGKDFKVGNTVTAVPAGFSEGQVIAKFEHATKDIPSWRPAPQSQIARFSSEGTSAPPEITYRIKEKGWYRLVSISTVGDVVTTNYSTVRRALDF